MGRDFNLGHLNSQSVEITSAVGGGDISVKYCRHSLDLIDWIFLIKNC